MIDGETRRISGAHGVETVDGPRAEVGGETGVGALDPQTEIRTAGTVRGREACLEARIAEKDRVNESRRNL